MRENDDPSTATPDALLRSARRRLDEVSAELALARHDIDAASRAPSEVAGLRLRVAASEARLEQQRAEIGSADRAPSPGLPEAPAHRASGRVLVVDDDELILGLLDAALGAAGYDVTLAESGAAALARLGGGAQPDLVISDVNMPDLNGFELLERLRSDPATRWMPLIFLTSRDAVHDVVRGLALGADDYLPKPFDLDELLARVRAKLERPPAPAESLPLDRRTGLAGEDRLREELAREFARASRGGAPGALAELSISELSSVRVRLGAPAADAAMRAVARAITGLGHPLDLAARTDDDRFLILLPETDATDARLRLGAIAERIASTPVEAAGERLRLTPNTGFVPFVEASSPHELTARATTAREFAAAHLDMVPQRWQDRMEAYIAARRAERDVRRRSSRLHRWKERLRVPFQIALTLVVGFVLPFILYWRLDVAGFDITEEMYLVVVVTLLVTGALILVEGMLALRRTEPPDEPGEDEPPASAIIAAYLPNEAATIIETIESFRRIDYPAGLQIILAYNTGEPLPVEARLREIADQDPRFVPLAVEGSTSKAQNVNAALATATGRFVGVFDADHHPDPGSFRRAWRWLSNGYDVVQGHCLVRNGDASLVARMVAIEFESIYAVSHPGRARMHGWGIFGGSNGYWRTDLLHGIRMRGSMLTEDIDSSLRVIEAGGRIKSDPGLVSRELATTTLRQVWNQRMRWAQGWFQVAMRHLRHGLLSRELSVRQKIGLVHLLLWRELYPWLSLQMFPIVAYWMWRRDTLDWFVPLFVATTIFTLSVGPLTVYFAYRLADPQIRQHRRWFLEYLVWATLFYTEYKNVIARVAQVKEAMRERAWKVTPRSDPPRPPE